MQMNRLLSAVIRASASVLVVLLSMTNGWAASTETVLYSFAGGSSDGSVPLAGLVSDKVGHLYGTTSTGGNSNACGIFGGSCGVVFELHRAAGGWTEKVLYIFQGGADGGTPYGGLVRDAKGNLYGTTFVGGASGNGTVFELVRGSGGTWTETVLYSFAGGTDGAEPRAGLLLKGNTLYGTTSLGGTGTACGIFGGPCGTVFQLKRANGVWTESVLYSFGGSTDGGLPYGGVVLDKAGNLYGTTSQNGPTGYGTVFELSPGNSGWTETTLYSFTGGSDGKVSYGGVVLDAHGSLYGTTSQGGDGGGGTVFQMKSGSGGWTLTTLHAFTGSPDGNYSEAGLVQKGNAFYGTTFGGGTGSACGPFGGTPCGTVFKVSRAKNTWNEEIMYSFLGGSDGALPSSGLIVNQEGNLFGTAAYAGTAGQGVVFEIHP
jgi:uncharacterized repeat protein (TIGR03803 family)